MICITFKLVYETFEDTIEIISSSIDNTTFGQKKKHKRKKQQHHDPQNITQKIKDRTMRGSRISISMLLIDADSIWRIKSSSNIMMTTYNFKEIRISQTLI